MQLHEIPMVKSYDIIGYTFNADIYCNGECVLVVLGELPAGADISGMPLAELREYVGTRQALRKQKFGTDDIEEALNVVANRRGINREDEGSFDSSSFPKVIFASEEFPDYCPRCAACGGVLDGFDPEDYKDDDNDD